MSDTSCGISSATTSCGIASATEMPPAPAANPTPLPPLAAGRQKLHEMFGLDLRSLALFRVTLAGMILCDLFERAQSLRAHYTDFGILPRTQVLRFFSDETNFSVHLATGTTVGIVCLFLLQAAAAIGLALGWRTRLMTILSWLLLISLGARNPQVMQAADILMRLALFWGLFLPLGARWSIDASSDPPPSPGRPTVCSIATVAFLVQLLSIYFFGVLHKYHPIWFEQADAVRRALALDMYVTPVGKWLRDYPALHPHLTRATLVLEAFGFLLVISPFRNGLARVLVVATFILFHLSLRVCLEIGHFSYIASICWLAVLPPCFWAWLHARLSTPARLALRIYYDGHCAFCRRGVLVLRTMLLIPQTPILRAQDEPEIDALMQARNSWVVVDPAGNRRLRFDGFIAVVEQSPIAWPIVPLLKLGPISRLGERAYEFVSSDRGRADRLTAPLRPRPVRLNPGTPAQAFIAGVLIYITAWNIRSVDFDRYVDYFPQTWNSFGLTLRVDQCWNMFAPMPLTSDGWIVVDARLVNGSHVDLWSGREVTFDKPENVAATYRDQRWRKYLEHLQLDSYAEESADFASWISRDWNARHGQAEQVRVLTVYFMKEVVTDTGKTPAERIMKYRYVAER